MPENFFYPKCLFKKLPVEKFRGHVVHGGGDVPSVVVYEGEGGHVVPVGGDLPSIVMYEGEGGLVGPSCPRHGLGRLDRLVGVVRV